LKSANNLIISLIVLGVLAVHLLNIYTPAVTTADENFYINDAHQILSGQDIRFPEHPSLGKYFIATGVYFFGHNPLGWRIFPVLFATVSVLLVYLLARQLAPGTKIPLIAAFLYATENITFVLGNVAMLDVFMLTFMLAGFIFYLDRRYVLSGVFMGLALLSKETAVFGILVILIHWLISGRKAIYSEFKQIILSFKGKHDITDSGIMGMSRFLIAITAVWCVMVPVLEYQKVALWYNPIARLLYIPWHLILSFSESPTYIGSLVPTNPLTWFITPWKTDVYYYSLAPGYLYEPGWNIVFLIIPCFIYLLFRKRPVFILSWFGVIYGFYLVLGLTGRALYPFYLHPLIPAACLIVAWVIWDLWERFRNKWVLAGVGAYGIVSILVFLFMSPTGTFLRIGN